MAFRKLLSSSAGSPWCRLLGPPQNKHMTCWFKFTVAAPLRRMQPIKKTLVEIRPPTPAPTGPSLVKPVILAAHFKLGDGLSQAVRAQSRGKRGSTALNRIPAES